MNASSFRNQEKLQGIVEHDPLPTSISVHNQSLLENMKVSQLQFMLPAAYLEPLVGSEHITLHEHNYSSPDGDLQQLATGLGDVTLE